MKKVLLCAAFIAASFTSIAQVGLGTVTPDASAALDIKATGTAATLLLPRLTTAERNAILSPIVGLVIFNETTKDLEIVVNNGGTLVWSSVLLNTTTAIATGTSTAVGKVGIGTVIPDTNAILDVDSTTQGVLLPVLSTDPTDSVEGMVYYNTTDNDVKLYNGSSWLVLTN